MHLRTRFSQSYVGHWVVARGDSVTLPEMGDRFRLTDVILDTARVAAGGTCRFGGALVFAVPRAETLAVTWYGSPEQALMYFERMKGFFFRLVITGLGLWVAETIVPGVRIDGWGNLVVAALLLGIVNAVIRPIILILTLPLTVLTLGLFILVVNGISVALVAWLMPGFALAGLWAAILTSIVVGLTSWFASAFVGGSGRIERYRRIEVTGRRLD